MTRAAGRIITEDQSGLRGEGLATAGWVVEVVLVFDTQTDHRFFAVGMAEAADAEELVLRFPGVMREDERVARRRLSARELASLQLRTEAVRSYGSGADLR